MIRIYNKNKKIGCYFYVEFKNNNFLKPMIIKDILFTPLGWVDGSPHVLQILLYHVIYAWVCGRSFLANSSNFFQIPHENCIILLKQKE